MNTVTTIRADKSLLDKIRIYSEIENKSQAEFINELLGVGMSNYLLKRSGAALVTLPNPQNYIIDTMEAKKTLDELRECARNNASNLPIPLYGIISFVEQRLFYELDEDREKFKDNMILDNLKCEIIKHINRTKKEVK